MFFYKILDLKLQSGLNLYYNKNKIDILKKELAKTLLDYPVEEGSREILYDSKYLLDSRYCNLKNGYDYISKNKDINKDSLRELYDRLSFNLLDDFSVENMGDYYRTKRVFLYNKSAIYFPFCCSEGVKVKHIDKMMNNLFKYINSDNDISYIDKYIKSQIIHLYFLLVHPYFDVNGRTARTLSKWYLVNNKCKNVLLFDNGITKDKFNYSRSIRSSKNGNITSFLEYMLNTVIKEIKIKSILEHDVVVTEMEKHSLEIILTNNNNCSIENFCLLNNYLMGYSSKELIIKEKIKPLIDKGIISNNNGILSVKLCINKEKIKKLLTKDNINYII